MRLFNAERSRRDGVETSRRAPPPRILMLTSRNLTKRAFQCAFCEGQDVLAEIDDVELIRPEPRSGFRLKTKWQRKVAVSGRAKETHLPQSWPV